MCVEVRSSVWPAVYCVVRSERRLSFSDTSSITPQSVAHVVYNTAHYNAHTLRWYWHKVVRNHGDKLFFKFIGRQHVQHIQQTGEAILVACREIIWRVLV